MPLYEYGCSACGKVSEIMQKFSDPPLTQCPECKAGTVTRLMSRTSFQLKGGGWYASDYKKPAAAPASTTDKPAAECAKPSDPNPTAGSCQAPSTETKQGVNSKNGQNS